MGMRLSFAQGSLLDSRCSCMEASIWHGTCRGELRIRLLMLMVLRMLRGLTSQPRYAGYELVCS